MQQSAIARPLTPTASDGACVTRAKEIWNAWLASGLQRLVDDGLVGLNVPLDRIVDALADECHAELVHKTRRN